MLTSEVPPITKPISLIGINIGQSSVLAPPSTQERHGKLARESMMGGGTGRRKRLRTSVAAPGRVRAECLRKRQGTGG